MSELKSWYNKYGAVKQHLQYHVDQLTVEPIKKAIRHMYELGYHPAQVAYWISMIAINEASTLTILHGVSTRKEERKQKETEQG